METVRIYGSAPFSIVAVHGGPGAPGEMAPVARELSSGWGVVEPLQEAATLQGQLKELDLQLETYADLPVVLVGHSWGAWLSFIFAAQNPHKIRKLILVSSGPFEDKYATNIMSTRLNRLSGEEHSKLSELTNALHDPDTKNKSAVLARFGRLVFKADSYDPLSFEAEKVDYQYSVYQNVWPEARELRRSGALLQLGRQIKCQVVAIHGDYDPHPYEGVKKPLSKIIKEFRFILLKECGHYPWLEHKAKDEFYELLKEELR